MNGINYHLLAKALKYYSDNRFQNTNLDWIIPKEYNDITMPPLGEAVSTKDGILVGSAEQSFIYKSLTDKSFAWLFDSNAQAITPCFRNDQEDVLHKKYFMKLELYRAINISNFKDPNRVAQFVLAEFLNAAYSFFFSELKRCLSPIDYSSTKIIYPLDVRNNFRFRPGLSNLPTLEVINTSQLHPTTSTPHTTDIASFDIILVPHNESSIELGSYGIRSYAGPLGSLLWIYGTGLALPRLSFCLEKMNGNL